MALQTSGQISLNDIHLEAGGTSGTQCTINDTDIRGLISSSQGSQVGFANYYGASGSITIYLPRTGYYYDSKTNSSIATFTSTGLNSTEYAALTGAFPGPSYSQGVSGSGICFRQGWYSPTSGYGDFNILNSDNAGSARAASQFTPNGVSFTSMELQYNTTTYASMTTGQWNAVAGGGGNMKVANVYNQDLNVSNWQLKIVI